MEVGLVGVREFCEGRRRRSEWEVKRRGGYSASIDIYLPFSTPSYQKNKTKKKVKMLESRDLVGLVGLSNLGSFHGEKVSLLHRDFYVQMMKAYFYLDC